jgi:hypothetical protein
MGVRALWHDQDRAIDLQDDFTSQIVQENPPPSFPTMGTNNHQVIISILGFSQDLINDEAMTDLRVSANRGLFKI